jgi:hypothetical protein
LGGSGFSRERVESSSAVNRLPYATPFFVASKDADNHKKSIIGFCDEIKGQEHY